MDAFWLNKPFVTIGKARDQKDDPNAVGSLI